MNVKETKYTHHLNLLIKIASSSTLQQRHGACLFLKDKIVSLGVNKQVCNWSVHAEIDALLMAKSNTKPKFKGLDIFIIRIGKGFDLRNSRPCQSCINKLKE
jgi:deoxycytidylate deaminase